MRLSNLFNFVTVVFLVVSCGKSLPEFNNVDLKIWKEDKNGCLNKRVTIGESVKQQKEKLLSLTEKQIVELLGKPDQNELYKRNQKFYSYFISPSPECNQDVASSEILVIRFNAMGLAKEVNIE